MASEDALLLRSMGGCSRETGSPLEEPAVRAAASSGIEQVEGGESLGDIRSRYDKLRSDELRPEYRGFTVPAEMDQDQTDAWFASIDAREDERERTESLSYRVPKAMSEAGRYFLGTHSDPEEEKRLQEKYDLDPVKGEPEFVKDLRGSGLRQVGLDLMDDPVGTVQKAKGAADEMAQKAILEDDPESARNLADIASLKDPTGASDIASAISSARLAYREPEKRGSHLTDVAISGAAGGIQVLASGVPLVGSLLSGARLKAAMRGADAADDVSDAARASRVSGAGVRRLFHASPADIDEFRPSLTGRYGSGVYMSASPDEGFARAAKGVFDEAPDSGNVLTLDVDLRNPLAYDDKIADISADQRQALIDSINKNGGEGESFLGQFGPDASLGDFYNRMLGTAGNPGARPGRGQSRSAQQVVKDAGYDGIIAPGGEEFIAFDPSAIKIVSKDRVADAAKAVPDAPAPVFEAAAEKLAAGLPDKLGVQGLEGMLGRKRHSKAGQVAEYTQDVKDKDTGKIIHKKGDKKLTKSGEEIVYPEYTYKDISASEWNDTKLDEFIETAKASGKKSISKDELIQHLDDNKVQIEEVRLGGTGSQEDALKIRKTDALDNVHDEAMSLATVLAPGKSVTDQVHRFSADPDHFLGLYIDYAKKVSRINIDVPDDMRDIILRISSADDSFPYTPALWKPEHAARVTEARNAVNAKLADPEYQKFVDQRQEVVGWMMVNGVDPDLMKQANERLLQHRNLQEASRILNDMPEVETRLAALRKFQDSSNFQEFKQANEAYHAASSKADTMFPQWEGRTVPGGTNYQEILLTVPTKRYTDLPEGFEVLELADLYKDEKSRRSWRGHYQVFRDGAPVGGLRGAFRTPEEAKQFAIDEINEADSWDYFRKRKKFTGSHHSDIPNVMAHIRTKTRIDSRGRKILFVEEIQSDWHQAGLKRGYQGAPLKLPDDLELAFKRLDGAQNNLPAIKDRYYKLLGEDDFSFKEMDALEAEIKAANIELASAKDNFAEAIKRNDPDNKFNRSFRSMPPVYASSTLPDLGSFRQQWNGMTGKGPPVPNAPLKDTKEWTALAIKRIFREAAEQGYDGVAFSRADMITPVVTLPPGEAVAVIGNPEAFLKRLADLKKQGGYVAEGAEQAEKVFGGNQYFYDKLIPSIAKKESFVPPDRLPDETTKQYQSRVKAARKARPQTTQIDIEGPSGDKSLEVPFFELTDKVKDKVIKPQKLYSVALPGIAIGAAAAEEEELSAAAALGAIGMGGMALYKGMKGARAATATAKAESYFEPEKLSQLKKQVQDFGERESLIYMSPDEFLSLAKPLSKPTADKAERVAAMLERGEKFGDIPFLDMKESGKIRGHEGRHRAMALKKLGVEKMPVRLMSDDVRWNEQVAGGDDDWYYVENLPKQLIGQDGKTKIKSPFHTEGPNRGKPLPEYSADAPKPPASGLSDFERAQLGTQKEGATYPFITEENWPILREMLLGKTAKKRNYKQTETFGPLDPELTAYTPGETLKLLSHPKIVSWHNKVSNYKIPDEYKTVVFVPCASSKPWGAAACGGKYYPAYNKILKDVESGEIPGPVFFATISEPLGIVPMDMWDEFPAYDVPGLFTSEPQRTGMEIKHWKASQFGDRYMVPFDKEAWDKSIEVLGDVVANFVKNNQSPDRQFMSFIETKKNKPTTHSLMLNRAEKTLDQEIVSPGARFPKGPDLPGHPQWPPTYDYIRKILVETDAARTPAADVATAGAKTEEGNPNFDAPMGDEAEVERVKEFMSEQAEAEPTDGFMGRVARGAEMVATSPQAAWAKYKSGEDWKPEAQISLEASGALDPTPASDFLSAALYASEGKYPEAAISGVAMAIPFIAGPSLIRIARALGEPPPNVVENVAIAGAGATEDLSKSRKLWEEMGEESPNFKAWTKGRPVKNIAEHPTIGPIKLPKSLRVTDAPDDPIFQARREYFESPLSGATDSRSRAIVKQADSAGMDVNEITRMDMYSQIPGVVRSHHGLTKQAADARRFGSGTGDLDLRYSEVGFHLGTKTSAQHRVFDLGGQDFGFGPLYDRPEYKPEIAEVYFRYNKLMPLEDPGSWEPDSILLQIINSAKKLNDPKVLKEATKMRGEVFQVMKQGDANLVHPDGPGYQEAVSVVNQKIRSLLKGNGYDGVIYQNRIEDPGSLSFIAIDPSDVKFAKDTSIGPVTGRFSDPKNMLKAAGFGTLPAARIATQQEEEQGNPSMDSGYEQSIDIGHVVEFGEQVIDKKLRADRLHETMMMIEAEYASLSKENADGKRGEVLNNWYSKTSGEFAAAEADFEQTEKDRYFMGSDFYYDTLPEGVEDFDQSRAFVIKDLRGPKIVMDIPLRQAQEEEQSIRFSETMKSGPRSVDLFGRSGSMNRYIMNKAKHFDHPLQSVQLNFSEKMSLKKDITNVEDLNEAGLISFLLYKELIGDVELL